MFPKSSKETYQINMRGFPSLSTVSLLQKYSTRKWAHKAPLPVPDHSATTPAKHSNKEDEYRRSYYFTAPAAPVCIYTRLKHQSLLG
jgi:hypothetical protein